MRRLGLHELRKEYLDFFRDKEHLILESFSLVPKDDPSLLLVGAGMAPLKKYFTGEAKPSNTRMASCQKCIRTGDIENVGKTDRHATFFEMLGNFSFGDYFKIESMEWAWEFLHEVLEIPEEDLWVTVYEEDDEAYELWRDKLNVPEEKIIRLGKEDNFWELEVGPSGPCSEIFVDRGIKYGCGENTCQPGCECDRFIEVWNLVFTQFDKDEAGVYHPLEHPNIDTGMGLERITAILEGADNIFEIEAIQDIINEIEEITGYEYGTDDGKDESIRVITDHSRAATFLVSDGVVPSNEGRGYILRRLIRRAARHGKLLGVNDIFLGRVAEVIIDSWKVEYEELETRKDHIKEIIKIEENRFQETIDQGLSILDSYIEKMREENLTELDGENAFKLYDTYGFPLDLTKEILSENKLTVDEKGFEENMEEQRQRARAARADIDSGWVSSGNIDIYEDMETVFKGYDELSLQTKIEAIFIGEEKVQKISKGDEGVIILEETPFYAESGGQVGDTGYMVLSGGKLRVTGTQKTDKDHVLHIVTVEEGEFKEGSLVSTFVDEERRELIKRNHSATHLLYQALKDVLGEGVQQAGSIVDQRRLRFDFTYHKPVTEEELIEIENIVNKQIFASLATNTVEMDYEDAKSMGITGMFEDVYGDTVRVMSIGEYSRELCGGTHVDNTNEIGMLKLTSQTGIAAGVRRVEAITSKEVYKYLNSLENTIDDVAEKIKSDKNSLVQRAESVMEELKDTNRELESLKTKLASSMTGDLVNEFEEIGEINFLAKKIDNTDMNGLRNLGDELKTKVDSAVIVLAGVKDDKLYFIVTISKELASEGYHAGNIVREVAKVTGGSGGGRPDMAQAGGKDLSKIEDALKLARELVEIK